MHANICITFLFICMGNEDTLAKTAKGANKKSQNEQGCSGIRGQTMHFMK